MIRLIFMAFSIAIFGKSPVSEVEVEKKELKETTIIDSDLLAIDFCGEGGSPRHRRAGRAVRA